MKFHNYPILYIIIIIIGNYTRIRNYKLASRFVSIFLFRLSVQPWNPNSKIPVTISSFANRRITRQLIPATRNASKRIHCPSRACPLTFPRRLSPSIDRSRARKDLYRTRLGISPTYNRLNDLDFISPLEPARRTIDLSSARSPPPQKDVAGILFHTHTHTTSCSRLVRAKGQERAAESSMPDVFSHFLMRLYPLARRTGLTITTIPRHGRRDVPSHSTRLPADRPIIEATSVLIFPTLSLSLAESRYGLHGGSRRSSRKRRMKYMISICEIEEIGFYLFIYLFSLSFVLSRVT